MKYLDFIKQEMAVIMDRDPAIKSKMEVFLYPSFWALLKYRKAHKLYKKGHFYRARKLSQRTARKTGIEIHPGATIGEGLFIDHGSGVIIGETAELGDNVTLYQGVSLGGTGKEQGKRHPTLKDNVMVSAGAKVLGSFTIGENSKIGAGSVVLNEVPPNCTVVGVPGRIVKIAMILLMVNASTCILAWILTALKCIGSGDWTLFLQLDYSYNIIWLCLALPISMAGFAVFGRIEVYDSPVIYQLLENGKRKRIRQKREDR